MPGVIDVRLLGPARVTIDGAPAPPALLWKKHLSLFVYMASARSARQGRDYLADLLWGDKPEARAHHSLNEAARVLRRVLGDDAVTATIDDIGIDRTRLTLDTDLFVALTARAAWEEAAAVIRGPFLEGFSVRGCPAFERWLSQMRAHWGVRSIGALTRAAATSRDRGDLAGALRWAEAARSLDAGSEEAVAELIRTHALRGERSLALAAYEEFAERALREEDRPPDPETIALAERIRRDAEGRPGRAGRTSVPPLVGRARQLSTLVGISGSVRESSRAAAVIVRGPMGIGKSRLLEEVAARVRLDGGQVAISRAVGADELEPAATLIALALALIDAPGVPAADPAALAALAERSATWRERFRGGSGQPMPAAEAGAAVIRAVAEETLLVLAIDDAHHADRISLQRLTGLLRDLAGHPLLLVLSVLDTARVEEIDVLAARAGRDGPGVVVHLAPLDADGVRELSATFIPALSADDRERVVRRVLQDGAGLPLLTTALLDAVRAGMQLRADDVPWPAPLHTLTATLPGEIPDSVAEAVRLTFRRLGAQSRQVTAAASVLPERVRLRRLAAATALPVATVEEALDDVERSGWLVWDERGYAFAARLVREIVARDLLTPGQRRRILERAMEDSTDS